MLRVKCYLFIMATMSLLGLSPFTTIAQGSPQEFYIAVVSPSGQMVVGAATNGLIRVWSAQTGNVLFDIANQSLPAPLSVAWSPDSKRLATAGGDPIIRVWCTDIVLNPPCTPGQLITQLQGHEDPIMSIAWSANNRLASGSQIETFSLRTWDMSTYQPLAKNVEGFVAQLAWHPSANLIAQVDASGAYILNGSLPTVADAAIARVGAHVQALSVAWNTSGSRIAYGTEDGKIYIADAVTKAQIAVLQGHTGKVYALAWNSDNVRLASSSNDGTIRIWNLTDSTAQVITANKNYAATLQISWSPDGTTLYYPNNGDTLIGLPSKTGLLGQYYDNIDLTNRKLNRVDGIVDFAWGTGSPNALIGVDTFSIRWTGQVVPQYSQTYTFYTQSDDGVRLWINNQQIINNWTDHQSVENSGTIALTAGVRYNVRMEYYENNNNTVARLSWSSSSQPKQVIPTSRLLPNGRIAFQSYRDGNDEIYLMNGDGTNPVNFTSNSAADQFPTAAVGTENVVFASTRTGNAEIFTAPLTGGAATNLTNHGSYDHYTSQAHDGRIAFASTRSAGGNFDLWTMNANGTGLTQLTNTSGGAERNSGWSPDGQWIVYDLDVSGVYDLWKIPAAGGTAVRLTQNVGSNSDPSWSPDGTTIVFKTTRDGGHAIYLMNADGTNQRPFKTGGLNGFNPTWSPDGTYITYQAFPTSQPDIYSIPLGGTTSTQLTNNAAADQAASWGAQ